MGAPYSGLYASSIYVIYGWLYFHPSTSLGSSISAALCIQPKISRARSFYLTRWLCIKLVFQVRLGNYARLKEWMLKGCRSESSFFSFQYCRSLFLLFLFFIQRCKLINKKVYLSQCKWLIKLINLTIIM